MNFREAESYLLSLGNEVETMKLGLDNITALLAAIGSPQTSYLKVQVAGTNGKGSVCAFLDSICLESGIRTGRYTSPHLVSLRERIKIDGVDISETAFAEHASEVRKAAESLVSDGALDVTPTFFEQITAIGLLAFRSAEVELVILETGLGGRYDATTAAKAELAAITRIDLDHQQYLGNSISEIAAEKAAIIRPDSRVILMHQTREAEQVLIGQCREAGVEPVWATTDVQTTLAGTPGYPIYCHDFRTEKDFYPNIESGLPGSHQAENASVAIGIAEQLQELGFKITNFDICIGLETAVHPGRLEFDRGILLDGAHNIGGARALAQFLKDFADGPVTLVFGAMRDKDVAPVLDVLAPLASTVILTEPSNERSMPAAELRTLLPESVRPETVTVTRSVEDALRTARAGKERHLVVVTGSLYLVGEVKRILEENRREI